MIHTEEDETWAMGQKTGLVEPSPLLLRIRDLFVRSGGSGDAFDFAVADYARVREETA